MSVIVRKKRRGRNNKERGAHLFSHSIPLPRLPPVPRNVIDLRRDEQPDDEKVDDHQRRVSAVVQRRVVGAINVG